MKLKIILPLMLFAMALPAQVAKEANSGYRSKEGRTGVAQTLAAPDRDARQKPQELVDAMAVRPGMAVADIGTGVGYMLPYLSRAAGPAGKVFAEDIFDDFLEKAKQTAARDKLANVTFVKGSETDPNLPENAIDVMLALDSYHHWDYPEKMLAALHNSLRPGGRLVIVDFYKRPDAMPDGRAMKHIRIDVPDVIKEIEASRFHLLSQREHIKDKQYMLVFERN